MSDFRTLAPGQRCQVWIGGPATAIPELLFETTDLLLEAPNWTLDGADLVLNGHGRVWRLPVADPQLEEVAYVDLPAVNNDHVLAPDGKDVYLSCMDGHVYRASLSGGEVRRTTPDDGRWHFLHGVSPDGERLAYVEIDDFANPGRLAVLPLAGGPVGYVETGPGHLDGPEWSADGKWIYFNTETFTEEAGHAQLARIADGGGTPERLHTSGTVDWFPHLSPDSRYASYISFPTGTLGHPADLDVTVHVVSTDDWSTPLQSYPLPGGQGTINVNSWSPTSDRFAFVSYPQA